MERTFKVGQPVWVYQAPCAPQVGEVTEVTSYGGVRVQTTGGLWTNQVYTRHAVFHRPADQKTLVAKMFDDADGLERAAQRLEAEMEDHNDH